MSAAPLRRSRLQAVPDHDLIDPAGLRNEPCRYCNCSTWFLERSIVDRAAYRIRCGRCSRVLVTTHGLTRRPPTNHREGMR